MRHLKSENKKKKKGGKRERKELQRAELDKLRRRGWRWMGGAFMQHE